MMQAAAKGKSVRCHWAKVTPLAVLTNKRLKVLNTPLKDWLVCGKCNFQQRHHSQCGSEFDSHCWMEDCKADNSNFLYMDELARELPADTPMYRLKR